MSSMPKLFILLITFLLAACVNVPTGPSVLTLPGSGVSFDQFRIDDNQCRQYAYEQVGGKTPSQSSMFSGVESAAIGSALGAIAGVAIGGGEGAAIGAGTGLLGGADWLDQDPPENQVLLANNATTIATYNACTLKVIVFLCQVKSLAILQELGAIIEAFLTRHQDTRFRHRHLAIVLQHFETVFLNI